MLSHSYLLFQFHLSLTYSRISILSYVFPLYSLSLGQSSRRDRRPCDFLTIAYSLILCTRSFFLSPHSHALVCISSWAHSSVAFVLSIVFSLALFSFLYTRSRWSLSLRLDSHTSNFLSFSSLYHASSYYLCMKDWMKGKISKNNNDRLKAMENRAWQDDVQIRSGGGWKYTSLP